MKRNVYIVPLLAATVTLSSAYCLAGDKYSEERGDKQEYTQSEARDVWREGKIESALLINTNLNNFKIDVEVQGDNAVLEGTVDSDAERDLAEEIALSIEGIESVDNKLELASAQSESDIKDAAITAMVNVGLMANDDVSAANIDVDTEDRVVTLKGYVKNDVQRDLAEKIAENVDEVKEVHNELKLADS